MNAVLGCAAAVALSALVSIAILLLFFRPAPEQEVEAPRWLGRAFAVAAAIAAAAIVDHLIRYPDGGNDAFIIWNLRARWLYRSAGDLRSALSPDLLFWAHPDYPLLLPALVARGFAFAGSENRLVPAIVACLFTASCVLVVLGGALPRWRWAAGLALLTTPAFVMQGATEQADIPLAAFLGAATAVLAARKNGDLRAVVAAGALASMAAWTKNEGSLHFLLLFAAVLLDERRLKAGAAFLAGACPFLVLLAVFKMSYSPGNDLLQASLAAALHRAGELDRWRTLLALAARRIVLLQAWGLHLLALIVWLLFGRKRTQSPPQIRWLSRVPAAIMIVHAGILLGQPHDLSFMFKVTIDRLLIQLWPMILILIARRTPAITPPAAPHSRMPAP